MSTLSTASTVVPLHESVRRLRTSLRTSPAPEFGGSAAERGRYLGYVGMHMLAWTAVGVLGSLATGTLVDAIAAVAA